MKTLLTIGGDTYLLPDTADAATILKQLNGAVRTTSETHYGPDNARYDGEHYFHACVKEDVRASIRLELVDDAHVLSRKDWDARCSAADLKAQNKDRVAAGQVQRLLPTA